MRKTKRACVTQGRALPYVGIISTPGMIKGTLTALACCAYNFWCNPTTSVMMVGGLGFSCNGLVLGRGEVNRNGSRRGC